MTPAIPTVDPIPLPAPGGLLWFLLMLTFTLHLLPMNLVLGGSILGAVARWRARRGQLHDAELARWIAKAMPILVSTTVTTGVAALLFLQVLYGRLFFVSSVLMAALWLGVIPVLVLLYYSSYVITFRGGQAPLWLSWVVAAAGVVIAFVYVNNMSLMVRPGVFHEMYGASARGLHLNLSDSTLWPRFLHVVTSAVGVSALAIAVLGVTTRRTNPLLGGWAVQYGCAWFAGATILNLVFGVWFLAALPASVLPQLIGQNAVATATVATAILFSGVSLGFVMAGAQSRDPSRAIFGASASLFLTLVLMIGARDFVRRAATGAAGFELPRWVSPQWGAIGLFFTLLLLALAVVGWMIAVLVNSAPRAGQPEAHDVRKRAHV